MRLLPLDRRPLRTVGVGIGIGIGIHPGTPFRTPHVASSGRRARLARCSTIFLAGQFLAAAVSCAAKPSATPVSEAESRPASAASSSSAASPVGIKGSDRVAPPSAGGVLVVESEGIGPDSERAIEAGCLSAIRRSVGTLLESEQVVTDDELSVDRIRSRSAAFIRRYDILSQTVEGGLVRVRLRVEIAKDQALMVAAEVRDYRAKVSGRTILTKIKTQQEALESGSSAVAEAIAELVKSPFIASVSEDGVLNLVGPKDRDMDIPLLDGRLPVPVLLSIDREAWNRNTGHLVSRLAHFGARVGTPSKIRLSTWRPLRDPAARTELERFAEDVQAVTGDVLKIRGLLERGPERPSIWMNEYIKSQASLAVEATVPDLARQEAAAGIRSVLGKFLSVGSTSIRARLPVHGISRQPWPNVEDRDPVRLVGVLHDVSPDEATFSVFRLDPKVIARAFRSGPPTDALSVRCLDAKGRAVSATRFPLSCPGGNMVFFAKVDIEGGRSTEGIILVMPGTPPCGIGFGFGQHRSLDAAGGLPFVVDEWLSVLPMSISGEDLDRMEEIELKFVP